MNYYPDMIAAVLEAVSGDTPGVARAFSRQAMHHENAPEGLTAAPRIQAGLLPRTLEHVRFPSIDALMEVLSDPHLADGIDVLFIAPPLQVERDSVWKSPVMRNGV